MSKNNLPEKIYLHEEPNATMPYITYFDDKPFSGSVEYVRKDVSGIDILQKMIPTDFRAMLNICSKSETITLSEIDSAIIVEAIDLLRQSQK